MIYQIKEWLSNIKDGIGKQPKVLEVGSQNINGSPREFFKGFKDVTVEEQFWSPEPSAYFGIGQKP